MMKLVVLLFALAFVGLAQGGTTTASPVAGSTCKHVSECGEGYCCVTHFMGVRKRRSGFFFNGMFGGKTEGKCEPERPENASCHVFMIHDLFNHELFDDYCPCMDGLECRGETVDESGSQIVHHNPKCQPKKTNAVAIDSVTL